MGKIRPFGLAVILNIPVVHPGNFLAQNTKWTLFHFHNGKFHNCFDPSSVLTTLSHQQHRKSQKKKKKKIFVAIYLAAAEFWFFLPKTQKSLHK